MESKIWVINDPAANEQEKKSPEPRRKKAYIVLAAVVLAAACGYLVYEFMFQGAGIEHAANPLPGTHTVKAADPDSIRKIAAEKIEKESGAVAGLVYNADDITLTNDKLLTLNEMEQRVLKTEGESEEGTKNRLACPKGYELVKIERIDMQKTYCYSPKKSFLLQKKTLDKIYTVTNYVYDKNKKPGLFQEMTQHYSLAGKKIER